ncbi:MAG: chemotaxis protein CheC [Chloroflexi bacterium]|nr:chemotaxis protein CheC [Chloroflexota bacterium]
MCSSALVNSTEISHLEEVTKVGFENAAKGLSIMVDKRIEVSSPTLALLPIEQVPNRIEQNDEAVVAIYLGVWGDVSGHMLLILSLEAAAEMVQMLMGSEIEGVLMLNALERSALGEVANVTGSFFLNALADATGLIIQPSPPDVMIDTAGAALDIPLLSLALTTEDVLIIDTWFIDDGRRIEGLFLMLPEVDSLRLIVERLEESRG